MVAIDIAVLACYLKNITSFAVRKETLHVVIQYYFPSVYVVRLPLLLASERDTYRGNTIENWGCLFIYLFICIYVWTYVCHFVL